MGITNEFERDLNAQAGLKRVGRVDLVVLQNTADAGDGHPGVQRCFRNYLHEGGMEKDLDLVGYGIKGTSVLINNAELQQLSNIGANIITNSIWSQIDNIEATTISAAQWVFVGEADQAVKQADSPTFGGLTINGNITITGNVDEVDVSAHDHSTGDKGVNVPFTSLSGDIIYTQLDSIVDIIGGGSSVLISRSDHVHTASDGSSKVDHVNLLSKGTNTHAQIDTHIESSANPHSVGLSQAFTIDKIISEATSEALAFQVGDASNKAKLYDGGLKLKSGSFVNEFSIDGTLAGNSDSAAPTEKAVKTYVTTHGWVHSGSVVFGPTTAPTDWQTLDLSGYVGNNFALVMLKVSDTTSGGNGYWFRPYGDNDDYETDNHTGAAAGNAKAVTDGSIIVMCETNSVGNLEWMAVNTASTRITLLGYIKET